MEKQLSHLQMAIMRALWKRGEATVSEVHVDLRKERKLATTTVATILSRLEKAGVVEHRSEGRQFVYRPLVSEGTVRRSMVSDLIDRLFQGNSAALVNHLLRESEIESGDLERVKDLIEGKEDEESADHAD